MLLETGPIKRVDTITSQKSNEIAPQSNKEGVRPVVQLNLHNAGHFIKRARSGELARARRAESQRHQYMTALGT